MDLPLNVAFLLVNAASAVAILAAIRTGRLVRREAWLSLAGAMVVYAFAGLTHVTAELATAPGLVVVGEGLYAIAYPLFFVAALRFATGARRLDPVIFIDAAIIAVGVAVLAWEILIEGSVPASLDGPSLVLATAYPVVSAVLVTLMLPLVLMRQTRSWSGLLVVIAYGVMGLADTRYAITSVAGQVDADTFSNVGWMVANGLLGLAALVPSAAALGAIAAPRTARRDHFRFVALSLALVIPPAVILKELLVGNVDEIWAFASAEILLAGLGVLRFHRMLGELISVDTRFERFMSNEGLFAAIKDGAGRYLYMNPTAQRSSEVPEGGRWFGLTDLELVPAELADRRRREDDAVRRTHETAVRASTVGDRRWLISRFPMPDNHGSVGVLGIDVSATARAEEQLRAAVRVTDQLTRERALIAETLASLDAGQTPEETAGAVCSRVLELADASIATVLTFDLDGIASVIGQVLLEGGLKRPITRDIRLSAERSAYLAERAAAGPWVERFVPIPRHPVTPTLRRLGIQAQAFAPLTHAGEVRGLLIVGSAAPEALEGLTEQLPAIAEFAQITGALLEPQLAVRLVSARARAAVRELIETEAFDIAFQPIVELGTGEIPGYEALARFHDGVEPDAHFRFAREAGLGPELELACLRRALEDADRLETGAWLNVNVSPELVLSDALLPLLPRDDRVVVLEITEHEAVTDYAAFRAAIRRLDGRVKVCVDDAGAGYASLRHIVELGPLFVKIDRSLVAGIASDAARQAVVAGMVRFAETAGLTLIAEGIETVEELRLLRLASVPLGQGYLLGQPVVPAAAGVPTGDLAAEGEAA